MLLRRQLKAGIDDGRRNKILFFICLVRYFDCIIFSHMVKLSGLLNCGGMRKMKYTNMQGTQIPMCMIGTWAWGSGAVGAEAIFGNTPEEKDLEHTFHTAMGLGFNLWDTAEVYGMGNAERILGRFAKKQANTLISTKFFPVLPAHMIGGMKKALRASMARMGIDNVDIYWIHMPLLIGSSLKQIIEMKKQGKINHIGVSNFSRKQLEAVSAKLKSAGLRLSAVQNHYSLLSHPEREREVINWCNKNGVVYFAYMVLEQGILTDRYTKENPFPKGSRRAKQFKKNKLSRIEPLIELMRQLAGEHNVKVAQIAVGWAICRGAVPIIGLTKPSQAEDLGKVIDLELSEEELTALEAAAEKTGVVIRAPLERKN